VALPQKAFSFTPGFSPVEKIRPLLRTVLTVSNRESGETVETVSADVSPLTPG
jgi:hypothetical protein